MTVPEKNIRKKKRLFRGRFGSVTVYVITCDSKPFTAKEQAKRKTIKLITDYDMPENLLWTEGNYKEKNYWDNVEILEIPYSDFTKEHITEERITK